uniref:Uncharacterized protein n=1 Tax=Siphoviridae sp. cttaA39 TaxID=2827960 RepID=A0A8S5TMT4_9CAUD|nr:MAG TPA: hypothetical protein [Siphoviridae sp. cttaA39]
MTKWLFRSCHIITPSLIFPLLVGFRKFLRRKLRNVDFLLFLLEIS